MTPVQRVLARRPDLKRSGNSWLGHCPAHDDANPSFGLKEGTDGRALIFCFAGCMPSAIAEAMGLPIAALYPNYRDPEDPPSPTTKQDHTAGLTLDRIAEIKHLPADFLRLLGCTTNGDRVRIPYRNVDGAVAAVRFRTGHPGGFQWTKGSHPIPYGLDRLSTARTAGWLLVVEGESDSWTAWYHQLPALGLPGKTVWKSDWARQLDGLEVFVWQEPGAEDLVHRLAADLPGLRVIVAPTDVKDLSEAHVQGRDVVELLGQLRADARLARDVVAEETTIRIRQARVAAESVLASPDVLSLIGKAMKDHGYGGDLRPPKLIYLAMTTRVLPMRSGAMPAHVLVHGSPSAGKNAAVRAAARLLPPEAVNQIDAGSAAVLIYDTVPLRHRVLIFAEADSLPAGEDSPHASAVRNLLQDGSLHYKVTELDPTTGERHVREIVKDGPTVLITTATRPLGDQLMSRLFTLDVPDEPGQLRAALAAQAQVELDGAIEPDPALVALQAYLQALAPIDVKIPYVTELALRLGAGATGARILRDAPRLYALIKAHAAIHAEQRARDPGGRLLATVADYRAVFELVANVYEASSGANDRIRETVAAVAELVEGQGLLAHATKREVAARLGISDPAAWQRIRRALEGGWLVNDESRKYHQALLRLGDPLPARSGLPSPDELTAWSPPVDTENAKTGRSSLIEVTGPDTGPIDRDQGVFTYSSDTGEDPADMWLEIEAGLPVDDETPDVGEPTFDEGFEPYAGVDAPWLGVD